MKIAIIRDGYTDYRVIRQFVSAIFEKHHAVSLTDEHFFDFEDLNIGSPIQQYIRKTKHADELKKSIINVLYAAVGNFHSAGDLIILNSDAEKTLGQKDNYFQGWAYSLYGVVTSAIDEFYDNNIAWGHNYEKLPLILPLILFPSSEILVAATMYDFNKENFRNLKPKPDLKQKVYGTDSMNEAVKSGKLDEVLSAFVIPESLGDIYREIPEARKLIQILSFSCNRKLGECAHTG